MTSVAATIVIVLLSSVVVTAAAIQYHHHYNYRRHHHHHHNHGVIILAFQPSPNKCCHYVASSRMALWHLDLNINSVSSNNLLVRRHSRQSHQRSAAGTTSSSPFPLYQSQQNPASKVTTSSSISTYPTLELTKKKWMYKNKFPIAYEVARIISASNGDDDHDDQDVNTAENGAEDNDEVVPILLLNGFGVGSFHQHRLMRQLLLQNAEYNSKHQLDDERQQQHLQQRRRRRRQQHLVIYGIDYLGQGDSWPITCNGDGTSEDELNLGYSADVWLDQLNDFINEVVLVSSLPSVSSSDDFWSATIATSSSSGTASSSSSSSSSNDNKKVHLIGNSVGAYLATILTNRHPHSIASLTLLNATPVWGLNLPGWDGRLPPPPLPKYVGGKLFNLIRNPNIINMYLQTAYVHPEAYDGTYEDCFYGSETLKENDASCIHVPLGVKIRACTEGKGGHAAFASILWSAPASEWKKTEAEDEDNCAKTKFTTPLPVDFYSTLGNVPVDVLLLFGANDPWCTPAIAKRMHTTLSERNDRNMHTNDGRVLVPLANRYVTLENAGHCPNHEAPAAVAKVVIPWIRASSSSSSMTTANMNGQQHPNRCNIPLVGQDGSEETREPWGVVRACEISLDESKELGVVDRIVSSIVS